MNDDENQVMGTHWLSHINSSYVRGALDCGAKPTVSVTKDSSLNVGYRVRLEVKLRHRFMEILQAIQRVLLQHDGIESTVKEEESSTRPYPILVIRGVENLDKLLNFNSFPWGYSFGYCLEVVKSGDHLTQSGLDEILREKGML
jgi:hypothetical protein